MTLNEFKAWFEGFQEGIDVTPTLPQWNRIREKINEVEEKPTIKPVEFPPFKKIPPYQNNVDPTCLK